jgi:putative ABC transport system ATP-binding protein
LIKLIDIKKSYVLPRLTIDILKGITLEVYTGELVAIMGPSGSGKSTLLNIIGCLDRPTSGQYLLEDIDVNEKTDNELASIRNTRVGFVFQSFNLLPRLPAWKNVAVPLLYAGVPVAERKEKAMDMLGKVGLEDRADHAPSELSGGEQQRVAIARALINNPSIILADEPTGNLDTRSGEEILEIFARLNDEGATIVMVTHERSLTEAARRIITIRDGMSVNGDS